MSISGEIVLYDDSMETACMAVLSLLCDSNVDIIHSAS